MQVKPGKFCPLIRKDCVGLKCSWFIQVRGMNPNTGEEIDEWGCAVAWMPTLSIENSRQQRSTASAVESFRNEVVKSNEENRQLYIEGLKSQQILPVNITSLTNTNLIEGGDSNETNNNT